MLSPSVGAGPVSCARVNEWFLCMPSAGFGDHVSVANPDETFQTIDA